MKNGFRGEGSLLCRFRHRRYGPHRDSRRPDVLALPPEALFWGLLSAFACALYTISPVGLILKYSAPVVVGWGMFLGSLVLMPVTLMTTFTGVVDTNTLLAFAYVVVFGTILSFVFYLGGVAYVSPSRGSIISALEPVSSVIFPSSSSA